MSGSYPTQAVLRRIERYNCLKRDTNELLQIIKDNWHHADVGGFNLKGKRIKRLQLNTFGWSGNESIISALENNKYFFWMFWEKSERGGHYWFKIRPFKEE